MPFIIYSALRIALIVLVGVVLYLVGMRGWLLGVVAVLVALLVSYLALSRPREAAALYIANRRTQRQTSGVRLNARLDRDNADEDDAVDSRVPSTEPTATPTSEHPAETTADAVSDTAPAAPVTARETPSGRQPGSDRQPEAEK